VGILLGRKLDYKFPTQRAEIYVTSQREVKWKFAGIWYLAGSNSSINSNPKEELGATEHEVKPRIVAFGMMNS
jgi:D-arabinan exo alpha-(1,3)/(1,5)-arabinofuranosidase (non-reducing end)